MREASESELEDVAEFFRRGENGDYAQAESPAAGDIFPESDEESEPLDPKRLEEQIQRRARYTRGVKVVIGALSLFVALALVTSVLNRSLAESAPVVAAAVKKPATSLPSQIDVARANSLDAPRPESWRPLSPTVTSLAATRGTRDAPSLRSAARQAFMKPVTRSVLPGAIMPKASIQAETSRGASRPPTARFAD